jgi:hypothetical protein
MAAYALARDLFAPPGAGGAHTRHILARAAGAHARLLGSTRAAHEPHVDHLRETLLQYLRGSAAAAEKRSLLDDPQLVEALHALAPSSRELADWDAAVAPGCNDLPPDRQASLGCGRLGNVVASVLLRRRHWCGRIELATDGYGRIHLPHCDWVTIVVDERGPVREMLAHQPIELHLTERRARWSLAGPDAVPLVSMPRNVFDAMFVDNRMFDHSPAGIEFGGSSIRSRFERLSRVNATRIRYEPIGGDPPTAHAELTGGIVAALVAAIERNAPGIHEQLCQCIRTVHGFELPPYGSGQISSFSVPTTPGVIGFNVEYAPGDEPQLSPFCFMWLGHELGHTINYLIDDVAFIHGWRFLENPGEITPIIPRYQRAIRVRTLFQIPYVHLFEWWLLIIFYEAGFRGLPWRVREDAVAVGEDLSAEIQESFDLIAQHARLTATGRAVVWRLRELVAEADAHWRRIALVATRGYC